MLFHRLLDTRILLLLTGVSYILFTIAAFGAHSESVGWATGKGLPTFFFAGFFRVGCGYGTGLLIYRFVKLGGVRPPAITFWVPLGVVAAVFLLPLAPNVTIDLLTVIFLFPLIIVLSLKAAVPGYAKRWGSWLGAYLTPYTQSIIRSCRWQRRYSAKSKRLERRLHGFS